MIELTEDPDDGTGRPYWRTTGHKVTDGWCVIGSEEESYHIEDCMGAEYEGDAAQEELAALTLVVAKLRELNGET